MRKLSKKISMLMVLAMLVGLFSGVVSASAASAWSFASGKYDVAVNGSINMESKEYADFDLLKDGAAPAGYTVAWASSDEDVVWVNAKTGQLRANKFGKAADGDKAVISATFTNTATKKSATRSFTIVLGAAKADFTVEAADVTIALGEEVKFAPVVKDAAGNVVKFATHKSYNGYFLDGKAITNPWTPEEAGEYTVTVAQFAKKADVADLAKAVRKDEVKVTVTVDADFDAKATGVKEITVYGNFAADAKFVVKKDTTQNIGFTTTVAADGKSAKLALKNRLVKGTYTVAYGDAKIDLAIEDEKVDSIVIYEKDGQIFTGDIDGVDGSGAPVVYKKAKAYVHYDVYNQYGESVRKSFDVDWNTSAAGGYEENVVEGIITVYKSTDKTESFNYNDTVVLTAVASGYGYAESETATMTIGLDDHAHSAKVVGIVKKDTSKLLQEIPASFLGGDYQLVFEMYNRAGYLMQFDKETAADDFTFTSLNPLLINKIDAGRNTDTTSKVKTIYIDGKAYGAVDIVAGMPDHVKNGGVAEIRITSTKTGNSESYFLRVVSEQILDSFKVVQPDFVIPYDNQYWSDGSKGNFEATLAFEATDVNGEKITDFRALYKSVTFSIPEVELVENNDGTAKLVYNTKNITAANKPTKQNDFPVVFTVIVPQSGKSDNVRLSVKYGRIASAFTKYNDAVDVLEGDSLKIFLRDHDTWNRDGGLDLADQYEDKIECNAYFQNRLVGVKVLGGASGLDIIKNVWDVKDDAGNDTGVDDTNLITITSDGYYLFDVQKNDTIFLEALNNVTDDAKEFAVEYALFEPNTNNTAYVVVGGSEMVVTYRVVDVRQCVGFYTYADDALLENGTPGDGTGYHVKGILANGSHIEIPNSIAGAGNSNAVVVYETELRKYSVKDSNGDVSTVGGAGAVTGAGMAANIVSANDMLFFDQSQKKANGDYADRTLVHDVAAKIYSKGTGINGTDALLDTVKTTIEVGAYEERFNKINTKGYVSGTFTWINGNTEAYINASNGDVTFENLISCIDNKVTNYNDSVYDANDIVIEITSLREGTKGYATNEIKLVRNAIKHTNKVVISYNPDGSVKETYTPMITGAEIGDTFTATYKIDDAVHTIKFTVGADQSARFYNSTQNLTYR